MKTTAMRASASALLGLVISQTLWAEDAANQVSMEEVAVTASRTERDLSDLSQALSIVDQSSIDRLGHSHISELLNRIPGVVISRGNGQEHLTAIRSAVLTGAGSCGTFYFAEDGIPLRAPGFCNVNMLFDVNSEQAGRIEVLRGPGTAVHGSNALNGVINVISRAPSEERETRIAAEGGPHDYSRLKFTHSDTVGKHAYRISAHGEHDGGYKDDSGYDQQKLSLRHDYQGEVWSVQSLLSAANLQQETAGYVLGKDAYKDDSRKRENPNPEAYRNSQSFRYYSRFEREGSQDSHFIVTPYIRYTDMEFLQHFLPGTPLEENGERSVGVQTAFYQRSSDRLTMHNGFDMEMTRAFLKETQDDAGFGVFPQGKHYDYEVDASYFAWFIGGDYLAGDATHISFGARYDIQFYDYDNRMISGNTAADGSLCGGGACRYARPDDDKERFRNWSFHVGMVHPLSDNTSLIANAAHGFRAPQASELYRLQAQQLNAQLDEESLDTAELGLRGEFSRFSYQASVYWLQKDDLIIQDSLRQNINGGRTESRGLELELRWAISDSLQWLFQGSYAKHQYDNSVLTKEGNELDTAPRQIASTQLVWQAANATQLTLEASHQGQYYLEADNQFRYPGHTLVNAQWRQQYGDHVYSIVRVNNLADVDYAERADYAFGNYRYFIGEPRSVFVELGVDF
ncbi:TonB-dependent receptor [Spongiibacter tropicus]|uniref:TonB-dependent receptor n=1 Tax=Spongiibacter tropicus TaxID=454602 RepID=UPI0035BE7960